MKILITEKQLNKLLYEYKGYTDVFDDLVDFIYDTILSYMQDNFDLSLSVEEAESMLSQQFETDVEISRLTLNENILKSFEIDFTNEIVVKLFFSENIKGGFLTDSIKLNENKQIQTFSIALNIITFFDNKDEVYEALNHELTHAYEACQKVLKSKTPVETLANNTNKSIDFSTEEIDEDIDEVIYTMSPKEINANISSLYSRLKSANVNQTNYGDVVRSSNIYLTIRKLNALKRIFEVNKNNIVDKIYEYSKDPKHVGIFPSSNRASKESYKKRLIKVAEIKKQKIIKRIDRLLKAYFNKNA